MLKNGGDRAVTFADETRGIGQQIGAHSLTVVAEMKTHYDRNRAQR